MSTILADTRWHAIDGMIDEILSAGMRGRVDRDYWAVTQDLILDTVESHTHGEYFPWVYLAMRFTMASTQLSKKVTDAYFADPAPVVLVWQKRPSALGVSVFRYPRPHGVSARTMVAAYDMTPGFFQAWYPTGRSIIKVSGTQNVKPFGRVNQKWRDMMLRDWIRIHTI